MTSELRINGSPKSVQSFAIFCGCFLVAMMLCLNAQANMEPSDGKIIIKYNYEREPDGVTKITPNSQYLEKLRTGQPVAARSWRPSNDGFFDWKFPELSFKVSNTTKKAIYFSELIISIKANSLNTDPILLVEENFDGLINIHNQGWGPVHDAQLDFELDIRVPSREAAGVTKHIVRKQIPIASFVDFILFDATPFIPAQLVGKKPRNSYDGLWATLTGTLTYKKTSGNPTLFRFESPINFGPPPKPFIPPSAVVYDVFLSAGVAPQTVRVPISQLVQTDSVDQFLIRIGTDRSARFEFTAQLRTTDGQVMSAGQFLLDIFVPRKQWQTHCVANLRHNNNSSNEVFFSGTNLQINFDEYLRKARLVNKKIDLGLLMVKFYDRQRKLQVISGKDVRGNREDFRDPLSSTELESAWRHDLRTRWDLQPNPMGDAKKLNLDFVLCDKPTSAENRDE